MELRSLAVLCLMVFLFVSLVTSGVEGDSSSSGGGRRRDKDRDCCSRLKNTVEDVLDIVNHIELKVNKLLKVCSVRRWPYGLKDGGGRSDRGKDDRGKGYGGKGDRGKGDRGKGDKGKGYGGKGDGGKGDKGKGEKGKRYGGYRG